MISARKALLPIALAVSAALIEAPTPAQAAEGQKAFAAFLGGPVITGPANNPRRPPGPPPGRPPGTRTVPPGPPPGVPPGPP